MKKIQERSKTRLNIEQRFPHGECTNEFITNHRMSEVRQFPLAFDTLLECVVKTWQSLSGRTSRVIGLRTANKNLGSGPTSQSVLESGLHSCYPREGKTLLLNKFHANPISPFLRSMQPIVGVDALPRRDLVTACSREARS